MDFEKRETHLMLLMLQLILLKICFEDGSHCLSLFLDLTKAFDCVNHSVLLEKLREYGFDDVSLSLVESFLKNRNQMVFWNGQWSRKMLIRNGVPQGSILGPLLFMVFVNDFPDFINMADLILFADDSTVTVGGSELNSLVTWSDVALFVYGKILVQCQ